MAKLLSKFFRVAQEGDTMDGREITRAQIQQMAKNYDPQKYAGRVWLEHFRGLLPGGPFDALGDVVALQVKEEDGKLGLYAQLAPLPALVEMNKKGQKLYSSIEMITNFAGTGEAYLVGLAVTDTPASLGTEMLAFSAGGANVVTGKTNEVQIEFTEEVRKDDGEGNPTLFSRVKALLGKDKSEHAARFSDMDKAIEAVATFAQDVQKSIPTDAVPRADFDALQQAHDGLMSEFTALKQRLETTSPGEKHNARERATGSDGRVVTDC